MSKNLVNKFLLTAVSWLLAGENAFAVCADLTGLENVISASGVPIEAQLVSSMSRLGYGVNPHSHLNTASIATVERFNGRAAAAKMLADAIRSSFSVAPQLWSPGVQKAEELFANSYSLNITAQYQRFVTFINAGDPHGANLYRMSLFQATRARKILSALHVPNYNVGEVLSDFWFNHLNVQVSTGIFGLDYDRTLRRNVCKTFYDVLLASAKHPAMVTYLNNNTNSKRIVSGGVVRADVNENYGREVIELHTLGSGPISGVVGGVPQYVYTQAEVFEASRVLTGWHYHVTPQVEFFFNANRNDTGVKTFPRLMSPLYGGPTTYNGGYNEAARFLLDLVRHPLTKRNICKKLARHLLGRDASSTLVTNCVMAYGEVGDLPNMYSSLLMSSEFWSAEQALKGFKTPFEYTVSVYRALGLAGNSGDATQNLTAVNSIGAASTRMGLPLFNYGPPTGYPVGVGAWASTAYINTAIAHAYQGAKPFVDTPSRTPLADQALEDYVASLTGGAITKQDRQLDLVYSVVPVFTKLEGTRIRQALKATLAAGKEDKRGGALLPLRTIVTQTAASSQFMKK
jgi:uncharacterized protein (DUF1800 family)